MIIIIHELWLLSLPFCGLVCI